MAEYAILQLITNVVDVDFRSIEYDLEAEARAAEQSGLPKEMTVLLRTGRLPFEERLLRR